MQLTVKDIVQDEPLRISAAVQLIDDGLIVTFLHGPLFSNNVSVTFYCSYIDVDNLYKE
jgi:hypothetical protein